MICIHPVPGSWSDRWIEYCTAHKIPFVSWDIFAPDGIKRIAEAKIRAVLFDLPLFDAKGARSAKSLVKALEVLGVEVFPNGASYWHYDDKLAQQYLFESLNIPSCPTYVFYSASDALSWAAKTSFPKVWKLRNGAGAANVRLVGSEREARRLIHRAFGSGFSPVQPVFADLKAKAFKHGRQRDWSSVVRRLPDTFRLSLLHHKWVPRERGYVYFQDFLAGNSFDTRVTVICHRAFAFRRFVRPDDFRASGSGRIDLDPAAIDLQMVKVAFEAAAKIHSRCLAFDLVYGSGRKPVVLEVCYRFLERVIHDCTGYWDRNLNFCAGHIWPQEAILEDMLETPDSTCAGNREIAAESRPS